MTLIAACPPRCPDFQKQVLLLLHSRTEQGRIWLLMIASSKCLKKFLCGKGLEIEEYFSSKQHSPYLTLN
ncbi:hypothetical protein AVEN_40255-1 [Araneus ventricosus]|uniref:Uncharacterized protein n=1 Tax=Araneus ventricosus TaxID=182803 RepID=A0A4Y2PL16_ARAVE|nr:hypothetical protein AVEN_40255-1 [Araneus ventricosus]